MAKTNRDNDTLVMNASTQLSEAARIMEAWARTLGKDNGNGARQPDIDWMMDRARRYQATAQSLGVSPTGPS